MKHLLGLHSLLRDPHTLLALHVCVRSIPLTVRPVDVARRHEREAAVIDDGALALAALLHGSLAS